MFFIENFISVLFNNQKIGLLKKNNVTNREEYAVYVSQSISPEALVTTPSPLKLFVRSQSCAVELNWSGEWGGEGVG